MQGGLTQLFQVPDVRGGGGEVAATTERYLELRIVYPDGTESEGFKIKDEALADLRKFFKTLPDGRYRIYLVRTENHSERLVIEVDVRHGRVIDVSDDSEGTRDRPPTEEEEAAAPCRWTRIRCWKPCRQGERQGDLETRRQRSSRGESTEDGRRASLPVSPCSLSPCLRRLWPPNPGPAGSTTPWPRPTKTPGGGSAGPVAGVGGPSAAAALLRQDAYRRATRLQ